MFWPSIAERLLEGIADPRGQASRTVLRIGRDAQHRELVAAEAGEEVIRAQPRLEAPRDSLDQLVADLMTERVVDVLEPVDIDVGRNRHARPRARRRTPSATPRPSRSCSGGWAVPKGHRAWLRGASALHAA